MKNLKVIAFDADDTLWINEPFFREAEDKFCQLFQDYMPLHSAHKELYRIEIANLPIYGYGIKGFMLSMMEAALSITDNHLPSNIVNRIIDIGKEMLDKPVELLEGVEETLKAVHGKYRLVLATKGDLLDQERKLIKSGLAKYFHHIEIMSEKHQEGYAKLMKHLDCKADEFLMIGNSLKSDVLPVLAIGGYAAHVPFHVTWVHEQIEFEINDPNFMELTTIKQLIDHL